MISAILHGLTTCLECKVGAVAEMDSFEAGGIVFVNVAMRIAACPGAMVGASEREHRLVGNTTALNETDSLELRKLCQFGDGVICEVDAAPQINVPYTIALLHKAFDGLVGDMATVTKVQIMQVLA